MADADLAMRRASVAQHRLMASEDVGGRLASNSSSLVANAAHDATVGRAVGHRAGHASIEPSQVDTDRWLVMDQVMASGVRQSLQPRIIGRPPALRADEPK
jgi:hypothetical protein